MRFFPTWRSTAFVAILAGCLFSNPAAVAGQSAIISGPNLGATGPEIVIESPISPDLVTNLSIPLIFDPDAGPMIKSFGTPRQPTGAPVQFIGSQPVLWFINEAFPLEPSGRVPRAPTDWHELILTPGWTWVFPQANPQQFPPGTSLITRDGEPWPFEVLPSSSDTRLDVIFPPIPVGSVLDIHKALLWIGATGPDDIWGDDPGETVVIVREYPTPEPSTIVLAAVGSIALFLAWWGRKV